MGDAARVRPPPADERRRAPPSAPADVELHERTVSAKRARRRATLLPAGSWERISPVPPDPDHGLRLAAFEKARVLSHAFNDIVPLRVLREGFQHDGRRISFGSFQKGIHRAKEQRGPAALTLTTSAKDPYDDLVTSIRGRSATAIELARSTSPTTAPFEQPASSRSPSSTSVASAQASTR